jgi:hypothetical protein
LRGYSLDETPLETLFFLLTESSPETVPDALGADRNDADRNGARL